MVDPVGTPNSFSDNIFTNGGSKDVNGISQWQWKMQMPQDKDDLEHAFGAVITDPGTGHSLLVTGADRYAANGNSTVGFWFFQNPISTKTDGTFSGIHTDGDLLLVVDFSVSSSYPPVTAFRWTGTDASGTLTPLSTPAGSTFAVVPAGPITVPWSFIDKYGATSPQTGELLEVGADLNLLFGGNAPRYVSFLTETRSSNSTNSTLSDFALGSVNTIGTGYKVKTGQYTNTVTVTGIDRGTNTTLVATDTNSHFGVAAQIQVQKAVNAVNPLHPTAAEDANAATSVFLPAGASVTWTYLVTNPGNVALRELSLVDDAGTPGVLGDDFSNPRYVSGDTNADNMLDPGETWLYTTDGIKSYTALPGQYSSRVTATASDNLLNQTVTANDAGNYFGSAPGTRIVTAINATIPSNPTGIEDANAAPGPAFVNGTSAVWTYKVFNTGNVALSLTSLKDNNGTTNITTDDFSPAPVLSSGYNVGDINRNNLLDTTEAWLYTSQGVKSYSVRSGQYSNIGTVTVTDPNTNQTVTASDVNYHWGQVNGEGLTPVFWKTNADSNGAVAWPRSSDPTGPLVYSPTQLLSSVFTLPSSLGLGTVTLNGALGLTGTTGANALMRSAVAALLNATHPRVAYPLTARQVIDRVNTALAGNTNGMNSLQSTLNGYNNLGSDLGQSGNTNGPLLADAQPARVQAGESLLTQAQLTPIVAEALARWATVTGLPALKPEDVHVVIADLPDGSNGQLPVLGYTTDGTVLIDVNAGGFGWFIDHTRAKTRNSVVNLRRADWLPLLPARLMERWIC